MSNTLDNTLIKKKKTELCATQATQPSLMQEQASLQQCCHFVIQHKAVDKWVLGGAEAPLNF